MIFYSYPGKQHEIERQVMLQNTDDNLKGEIEKIAMELETEYDIPFRCIAVYEEKDGDMNDLS